MVDRFSFYWHDYETFGADPRRDRPAQFAGLRTTPALELVGEPLVIYCRPAEDTLPSPEACLVTGITPQIAAENGVVEAEFMARILAELECPGTCGVGYNSIRFDDEFTRYGLYRNLFDPYAREWQNGNSRWDIIDTVRLAYALRPQGIEWPLREDGAPSFRLEDLTAANDIGHADAHDALADVRATIELARLLKRRQPRLFDYALGLRDKRAAARRLDLENKQPVLHVSARYPSVYGCTALVAPIARHPRNANGVIVFDLRFDPAPLEELKPDALRERVFRRSEDLPQGVDRVPLKVVHINRSPVLAPLGTLDSAAAERLQIDLEAGQERAGRLRGMRGLATKLEEVYRMPETPGRGDPEQALYSGGFLSDADRVRLRAVHAMSPADLAERPPTFDDDRLPELLFRYRARNFPETLSDDESRRWEAYRRRRLTDPEGGGALTIGAYRENLAARTGEAGRSERDLGILRDLAQWGDYLIPKSGS